MSTGEPPVAPGDRFSRTHTFDPAQVAAFSLAAGDDNPLHLDAQVAAASRYGGLIVSGTHTSALLLGLTASHFSRRHAVVGVEFTVKFERAVPADATVHIEWVVREVRPHPRRPAWWVDMTGTLGESESSVAVSATGTVLVQQG